MKATVNRNELAEALGIAYSACSNRTTMPILSMMRLEAEGDKINLLGCDGELWASANVQATVTTAGAICVASRVLNDIVSKMREGMIDIEMKGTDVVIRQGTHSVWRLLALPPEDFPEIPEFEANAEITISLGQLRQGTTAVNYAISDDASRQALTGVFFSYDGEALTMVATDSHRLAHFKLEQEGVGSAVTAVVPGKALRTLRMLGLQDDETITIRFDQRRIGVDVGEVRVVCQLLGYAFPEWRRVVPTAHTRSWVLDREEFSAALDRIMILARGTSYRVQLTGSGDVLTLSARSEEIGDAHEEIACASEDGDIPIAFNGRYLADAVSAMDSKSLRVELTESSRPAIVRPGEQPERIDQFCVIMPMAL